MCMLHTLNFGVESLFRGNTDEEILSCFVSSFAATLTIPRLLSVYFSASQPHQGIGVLTCRRSLSGGGEYWIAYGIRNSRHLLVYCVVS